MNPLRFRILSFLWKNCNFSSHLNTQEVKGDHPDEGTAVPSSRTGPGDADRRIDTSGAILSRNSGHLIDEVNKIVFIGQI